MLTFETKKKFFSSLFVASGKATQSLSNEKSIALAESFLVLLSELANSNDSELKNIQGRNASELLFVSGTFIEDDTMMPVELTVNSIFIGSKKRGEFLFTVAVSSRQGNATSSNASFSDGKAFLQNSTLTVDRLRLGLEWLSPHYFSYLGFAPTVEDFIHLEVNEQKATLRFGGDNLPDKSPTPIKDAVLWEKTENILEPVFS